TRTSAVRSLGARAWRVTARFARRRSAFARALRREDREVDHRRRYASSGPRQVGDESDVDGQDGALRATVRRVGPLRSRRSAISSPLEFASVTLPRPRGGASSPCLCAPCPSRTFFKLTHRSGWPLVQWSPLDESPTR